VLALTLLLPSVATYGYFVVFAGEPSMSLLYAATKVGQFALPAAWVLLVQRRRIGWARPSVGSLAAGAGFGLFAAGAALAAYFGYFRGSAELAAAPELVSAKVRDMGLTTPGRYFAFAFFLSLPHALLEEYYWRWFVYGESRRVMPFGWAIALSSLGFLAHHVIVIDQLLHAVWWLTLLLSASVGIGGAVWACLYQRFGAIYSPWISHVIVDCVIMGIGYDLMARG